ncbi:hypothetical protein ACI1MP_00075 [Kitasatospora griseola]|uniref:hypothetical protein n=1 Tax=Kitasatospora griseola TaxID=2064 RepID=UPI003855C0D7
MRAALADAADPWAAATATERAVVEELLAAAAADGGRAEADGALAVLAQRHPWAVQRPVPVARPAEAASAAPPTMPIMETDTSARRSEDSPGRTCRGCGKPLPPHTGRGRPKKSCNRACESKAYRRTAAERRHDALAAALVPPRGGNDGAPQDGPERGSAQRRELLELAARVQRLAAGYLERIDAAAARTGDDANGVEALRLLETGLTALSGRMLRLGRTICYETLYGDGDWSPAAGMPARQQAPAAPAEAALVPSRGGSDGGGGGSDGRTGPRGDSAPTPPRPPADRPQPLPGPVPAPSGGADLTPPRGGIQDGRGPAPIPPRGDSEAAAPAAPAPAQSAAPQPQRDAPADGQPRLALAAQRTVPFPADLGEPDLSQSFGALTAHAWRGRTGLVALHRGGQRIGWVQQGLPDLPGWAALVDGRLVLDAIDREPLLATDAQPAADLLVLALRQGLI